MKIKFIITVSLCFFLSFFSSFAVSEEHIIIYGISERTQEIAQLKKFLEKNKIMISLYNKTDQIEKHIENLYKINRSNASFLIGLNIEINEKEDVFIAVPEILHEKTKSNERFRFIEEMPFIYEKENKELAMAIASSFNGKIKTLPLFFSVGLDMPCVFVSITTKKENINIAFERLYGGIKSYLKRGEKHEK